METFKQALRDRIAAKDTLDIQEFELLRDLLARHSSQFKIIDMGTKQTRQPLKIQLGMPSEIPFNPVTGREYTGKSGDILLTEMASAKESGLNWCGQFAGKKQWEKIGRKLDDYVEEGYYLCDYMGKKIYVHPYEDTVPIE